MTGWAPWQEFSQAVISPEDFALRPGQAREVKVTVRSTDGYAHRLAVTALTNPKSLGTGASVTPAIAAVYKIPGKPNPYPAAAVPRPVPPAPPFDWLPVALGVGGAAVLAALVTAARKLKISKR